MMAVERIRKRLLCSSLLFAAAFMLTLWLAIKSMPEGAIPRGLVSFIALLLLIRAITTLYNANLIYDNRILAVPSAVISKWQNETGTVAEETVVSTFGILLGGEAIKWGCDGRHGVNLKEIKLDRAYITLTFGTTTEMMQVKLLHGLTDPETVSGICKKLLHETGVEADISGWQ